MNKIIKKLNEILKKINKLNVKNKDKKYLYLNIKIMDNLVNSLDLIDNYILNNFDDLDINETIKNEFINLENEKQIINSFMPLLLMNQIHLNK
tara:strand:- start:2973 stop:3251 length:279 start_codon:yes stop_codon:yes gene_type:complete